MSLLRNTLKRSTRLVINILLFALVVNAILAIVTNVSTRVTTADESMFRSFLGLKQPDHPQTYNEEIKLLRKVQKSVIDKAPVGTPIPEYSAREPEDLFKQGSGLCFDRARTYDKVFSWLGFKTRHVYILYSEHPDTGLPLPYWQAIFVRGTGSHAVTEVRTKKGWVVVDSNSTWISLNRDGLPINADEIPRRAGEFKRIPWWFNRDYFAIRGLYSRHGRFYQPYLPYPEFNWYDFLSWVLEL